MDWLAQVLAEQNHSLEVPLGFHRKEKSLGLLAF